MATSKCGGRGEAGSSGTLGDLLYADTEKERPPEAEWVALVHAIGTGDQHALRALYGRTHRLVFTLMMRLSGDRETAEELTVDVFHGVWQRAATYDAEIGTVIAWIMNQARSRAIDRLRFEQRKKRSKPYRASGPASTGGDVQEQAVQASQQGRLLQSALKELSTNERQAIETAYFSELTYTETAARLNEPLGTVKTRIRSGLRKLREALSGAVNAS